MLMSRVCWHYSRTSVLYFAKCLRWEEAEEGGKVKNEVSIRKKPSRFLKKKGFTALKPLAASLALRYPRSLPLFHSHPPIPSSSP